MVNTCGRDVAEETFSAMGLGNESYEHLVRVAARMADVDADEEVTDMGDEDARVRLIWAAAANARRANLSLAMANAARAVALEICEWGAPGEVTVRDLQGAWTVLAEMIRREKGRAASYARRAEDFRAQASRTD